MPINVAILIC